MKLPAIQSLLRAVLSVGLAVMLSLQVSGLGKLLYACSMTGEVGPRCCCDHAREDRRDGQDALEGEPCCERVGERAVLQVIPSVSPELLPEELPLWRPPARVLARQALLIPGDQSPPPQARGPPRAQGPPLFLQHRSLLI